MELEDKDEEQNKDPVFSVLEFPHVFMVVKNHMKDGVLTLMQVCVLMKYHIYLLNNISIIAEVIQSSLFNVRISTGT